MQIDIPHPPTTKAWYWGANSLSKDPVEVEIESVNIWIEETRTFITYSFKKEHDNLMFGRHDMVFNTFEEATKYRDEQLKILRESFKNDKA